MIWKSINNTYNRLDMRMCNIKPRFDILSLTKKVR